jgi:hypothetical protein
VGITIWVFLPRHKIPSMKVTEVDPSNRKTCLGTAGSRPPRKLIFNASLQALIGWSELS